MISREEEIISIARIYYPVKVLGPGSRVGIWTTGCNNNCEGCISPELKQYDKSKEIPVKAVIDMLTSIPDRIDGFTLSGGEPFYNPRAISCLTEQLSYISDDIIIFTGFRLEELVEMKDPYIDRTLNNCSVLIDGPYIGEMNNNIGLRGSSNQKIHIFKHKERYEGLADAPRSFQLIRYGDNLLTLGMPFGDPK